MVKCLFMKYTDWKIPYAEPDMSGLSGLGYSPLLKACLAAKGLTAAEAEAFISGEAPLSDPYAFLDMDKAVSRLRQAIANSEHTAVYGDYDVDGITATCLMGDCLRGAGLECELYIPDRLEEGYGLNTAAIDSLAAMGVTLIVTVDCGVTGVAEAEHAARLGIDMIITDHHQCAETLPAARAVVDPKRPGCGGYADLAGVGVAFKLASALTGDGAAALSRYADIIALGTVADIMPLTGENRRVVKAGLKKLSVSPRPGLAALLAASGADGARLSAGTLGFTLAPRLNAAGRLGNPSLALSLLLSEDEAECISLAEELCELNRSRQRLETSIWDEANALLAEYTEGPVIIASDKWHQGVVGIVASRLAEKYRAPAFMLCVDGNACKGSCRSFGGFDLFASLCSCRELLDGFGGHTLAAGLTISTDKLIDFKQAVTEYHRLNPPATDSHIEADLAVSSAELLTMRCAEELELLEPCGAGNPRVLLFLGGVRVESIIPMGGGNHTKLRLSRFGQIYECVYFSCSPEDTGVRAGDVADIIFTPQVNEFRSRRTLQLLIEDIRRADESELSLTILRYGLYERDGLARIPQAYLQPHIPVRADFAKLWQKIRAANGELTLQAAPCVKDALCLAVFAELGLLEYTLNETGANGTERGVHITANLGAEKVGLSDSAILRTLTGNGGGIK